MVGGRQRVEEQLPARRQGADRIALQRRHRRLIQGVPVRDPVAETLRHDVCVVGEALGRVPVEPSALRFDRTGHLPVEESRERDHSGVEQEIDETGVVVESRDFTGSPAVRLDACPRDGESVAVETEPGGQSHIGLRMPITVARGLRGRPVDDRTRPLEEVVPDGSSGWRCGAGTLDLERRGRRRPAEACGRGRTNDFGGHVAP